LNASGKVVAEERGAVQATEWFPEAGRELVEEVIELGRYGKTLTVLTVAQDRAGSGYASLQSCSAP
jgi:hypothetical protein